MSESTTGPGFTDAQRAALACVLDTLVPPSPDGRLPGAGALGLAGPLEALVAATPGLGAVVAAGLEALEALARSRGADGFAALVPAVREEALRALAETQPGFAATLHFQACLAYYREPRVLAGLGLEPAPPHPKGHAMEPFDDSLLEPVRRRAPFFRPA